MTWLVFLIPYWKAILGVIGGFVGLLYFRSNVKAKIENKQLEREIKKRDDERTMNEIYQKDQEEKQTKWLSDEKKIQEWRSSIDLDLLSRDPVAKRLYDTDPVRFTQTYYPGQQFIITDAGEKD